MGYLQPHALAAAGTRGSCKLGLPLRPAPSSYRLHHPTALICRGVPPRVRAPGDAAAPVGRVARQQGALCLWPGDARALPGQAVPAGGPGVHVCVWLAGSGVGWYRTQALLRTWAGRPACTVPPSIAGQSPHTSSPPLPSPSLSPQVAMNIDPRDKMPNLSEKPDGVHAKLEKYILRKVGLPDWLVCKRRDATAAAPGWPALPSINRGRILLLKKAPVLTLPMPLFTHPTAPAPPNPCPTPALRPLTTPSSRTCRTRCCSGRRSSSATAWATTGWTASRSTPTRCGGEGGVQQRRMMGCSSGAGVQLWATTRLDSGSVLFSRHAANPHSLACRPASAPNSPPLSPPHLSPRW